MGFVSNKEEEANKCLKEMDLDGDGRVSFAEFMVKWKVTWLWINEVTTEINIHQNYLWSNSFNNENIKHKIECVDG